LFRCHFVFLESLSPFAFRNTIHTYSFVFYIRFLYAYCFHHVILYVYYLPYFLLPPVFVPSTVHGLPRFFRLRLAGYFYVLGCFFYPDSTWSYAGLCSAVFISFGYSLLSEGGIKPNSKAPKRLLD
jgi:hypothetical protein